MLAEVLNHAWLDHAAFPTQTEVQFVDEKEIRNLHEKFLNDASPTDVITFDLGTTPEGWRLAVMTICLPVAQRYAQKYRTELRREVQRLIIHGALHLLGYDDHHPKTKQRMRAIENKMLRQIRQREEVLNA